MPGIVAAQRFRLAGRPSPGEPDVQYLALYELDADDPQAVVQAWRTEYRPQWQAAGRGIECIAAVSLTTFTALGERQVARNPRGPLRAIVLVPTRCTDPAREAEFNRWYDEVHVPDVLDWPHRRAGQRFKLAGPPSPGEPTVQYLALYELDSDDPDGVSAGGRGTSRPSTHGGPTAHVCLEVISRVAFVPVGARQEAQAVGAGG